MKTTFCLIQDKYKYICLDLGQARRCGRRGKTGVSALNTKKQTNENNNIKRKKQAGAELCQAQVKLG